MSRVLAFVFLIACAGPESAPSTGEPSATTTNETGTELFNGETWCILVPEQDDEANAPARMRAACGEPKACVVVRATGATECGRFWVTFPPGAPIALPAL